VPLTNLGGTYFLTKATLAELADATDLKSVSLRRVRVRFSQVAPFIEEMNMKESREEFEKIISSTPYSKSIERYGFEYREYSWPSQYVDYAVQLAWEFWQEGIKFGHQRDKNE